MEREELAAAVRREALEATLAAKVGDLATAADEHAHGADDLTSVRRATHAGREIVVRTTYEITIDGEPLDVRMNVDNAGRVHYHGLPTRDFASVIDLVAKVIDQFPDDLPVPDDHDDHDDHGPDHHRHHGGG
jgi:hypothetical protein